MELKKRFKLYKSGKMWCCAAVAFGALAFGTVNGQADDNTPASSPVTTAQVATTSQSSTTTATDSNVSSATATINAATNTATTAVATNSATAQTSQASQSQAPVTTATATTETTHAATNNGIGTINTLDISAYQPGISAGTFAQYHNQGINNVIVKLSEGTGYTNLYAQSQVNNAKQAGMNVAAYHFVRFTTASEAQAEAQLFARMARGIGLGSDTLMIADVEQVPQTQYAGIANNLNVFWQTLDSLGFTNHGVYTGYYYDRQYNVSSTVGKNRTWVAAYGNYRNLVQSQGYGAWQYTDNWNGTHIDASIDLGMFASYIGGVTSASNLDNFNINAANGTLNVSGWFADNNSEGLNNRYIILLDGTTNTEITRQSVQAETRTDVANAYPDITGASTSGFYADFAINGNLANAIAQGHPIKVLFRYTSSADGNSNYVDHTFDGVTFNQNFAWLDGLTVANDGIHVSGWHIASQSVNRPYHYIIVYDKTTGRELDRQYAATTSRNDVQQSYQNVYGSGNSGFNANLEMNDAIKAAIQNEDTIQLISRYTDDATVGNGNYVDYWFAPKSFNHNQAYLDKFSLSNGQILVSGWHAADQSTVEPNQWVILIDSQSGQEVARVKANTTSRPDVGSRYSDIDNSSNSGFNATFDIAQCDELRSSLLAGHTLKVVVRYSDNSENGEGNNTDYWFNNVPNLAEKFNYNFGFLDSMARVNDDITVSGWHISNQSVGRQYHYVILYDVTQGREITRNLITTSQRRDVQERYPNVYNSGDSGFATTFSSVDNPNLRRALANGDTFRIIDRYTSSRNGNSDYVDYWFDARKF